MSAFDALPAALRAWLRRRFPSGADLHVPKRLTATEQQARDDAIRQGHAINLEDGITEPDSVRELAEAHGMSARSVYRILRSVTSVGPMSRSEGVDSQ